MNKATRHTFQVLTKRAERLEELAPYLNWSPNIWQGVTVESDQYKYAFPLIFEAIPKPDRCVPRQFHETESVKQ